ncbi:MAG: hypothetical protein JOZ69_14855 [Myxococcales bacterium]|nr:hypothetical protein [Myxococcales bacterium]
MRNLAFVLMLIVTAWSFWAWAEPTRPEGHASHGAEQAREHAAAGASGPAENAGDRERQGRQTREGEEAPGPINWLEFGKETPPFLAMLINFGILAAGYYYLGRKPIAAALQQRRDGVAREIEEAARMRQEAEARAKVYQAKLAKLDEEVRTTREALIRAGEAERDRIVADAEATAERMRKDAQFLVEQEMKQIRQDLWRETLQAAITTAEDLLKRRVSMGDQERLAEDYLADLGAKSRGPSHTAPTVRPAGPDAGNAS